MSLFDYPRFNFKGTLQLNPGTANNDDYAQQPSAMLPKSYGKYAGCVLGLIDSKTVTPRTYGMLDADFISWVQKAQTFDTPKGYPTPQTDIIPAEWNYYGGMESKNLSIKVVGVQTGPDPTKVSADAAAAIGATLTYSGTITDVNSEGSPPATQFFIDNLTLQDATTLLSGTASKGACQWLNFYRNINRQADGGAGGYVYHVMRKNDPGTSIKLPGFDDPRIVGVICRYYLYRFGSKVSGNAAIEQLYQNHGTNPATLEIVGTFAPLFENEKIVTGPVGRLLVANDTTIPTPAGTNNNGGPPGLIALGPAVLQSKGTAISVDFSGTFPDYFTALSAPNPKYNFHAVTLVVSNATGSAPIGPVDYADTDAGDRRGWIFDFDISSNAAARKILQDPEAKFSLQHETLGTVLEETDYYFVSNQQGIYAEQNDPGNSFLNQGTSEPATVAVYHRGLELSPAQCPPISVWQYRSVPIQSPGDVELITANFKPGQPLQVDTSQPGNFLFTFSIGTTAGFPPQNYNTFMGPPTITNAPSISLRILPNDEDFNKYYVDPNAAKPVGNDLLTFDVVYQKVLRTYYLLYPAMNKFIPLNNVARVTAAAPAILKLTDPALTSWTSSEFMPRTRDMSASRRKLLQAWCRKVHPGA